MQEPAATILKLQPVEEIIAQRSNPATTLNISMASRIKQTCISLPGIALISAITFFGLLLILQPRYIFKKSKDDTASKKINYWIVLGIALVGGLCVYVIPKLITMSE